MKREDTAKGVPWAQLVATISDNQNGVGGEGERESRRRVSEVVVEKVSREWSRRGSSLS